MSSEQQDVVMGLDYDETAPAKQYVIKFVKGNPLEESRTVKNKRMEFSVLTARVHLWRQVG